MVSCISCPQVVIKNPKQSILYTVKGFKARMENFNKGTSEMGLKLANTASSTFNRKIPSLLLKIEEIIINFQAIFLYFHFNLQTNSNTCFERSNYKNDININGNVNDLSPWRKTFYGALQRSWNFSKKSLCFIWNLLSLAEANYILSLPFFLGFST